MSATEYILRSYPFVLFLSQLLKLSNLVIPTLGYQILQLPLQILHSPLSILNYNWLREWIQITTKWFEHRRAKFRFDYSDVRCLQIWFSNLLYIQKVWKWSLMSFAKEVWNCHQLQMSSCRRDCKIQSKVTALVWGGDNQQSTNKQTNNQQTKQIMPVRLQNSI